jgi:hypothetical protein
MVEDQPTLTAEDAAGASAEEEALQEPKLPMAQDLGTETTTVEAEI